MPGHARVSAADADGGHGGRDGDGDLGLRCQHTEVQLLQRFGDSRLHVGRVGRRVVVLVSRRDVRVAGLSRVPRPRQMLLLSGGSNVRLLCQFSFLG